MKYIFILFILTTSVLNKQNVPAYNGEQSTINFNNYNSLETDDLNIDQNDCWWRVSDTPYVSTKRGVSCGSDSSLKVYYTNPYNFKIKVAFYIFDTNGNTYNNRPYVESLGPGRKAYHHQCYSNGRYAVAVKRYEDSECRFPNTK